MDAINTRIADLVRESGKTKTEWANQLRVTPQFVSSLCNGKTKPSDRTIADICRVSGVREEWLKDGVEPIYAAQEPEPLETLLAGLLDGENVTTEDRVLIKNFLELSDDSRKEVIKFVQKCAQELSAPVTDQAQGGDLASRVATLEKELASEKARADRAEAEAKARTEELLAVYREDTAEKLPEPVSESVIPSRSR